MKIVLLSHNQVILCSSHYCYHKASEPSDNSLHSYKGYINLECSFDEAVERYDELLKIYPILHNDVRPGYCAGEPLKEFSK